MSSTSTSNIGLGALSTTSTGSTSLGSTLFGIDINKLVDNLVEAKGIVNLRRQDKIDANTAKLSGYSSLQSLLSNLQSSVNFLRNPRVTSGLSDAFDAKTTLSNASGSIEASKLYGVSAADTALTGDYQITINRVAKTDTISSTAAITNSTSATPVLTDGALSLNGTSISLTSSMSLTQIKDAINNNSGVTKVKASIVQAGTNDFRIVLKGTDTGKAIDLTGSDANVLSELGLAASGATNTSLSAELVLDGVTVIRASNSVNDLIAGVSIELYQADVGNPISLSISNDLSYISDAVISFMDSYNAIVDFVKAQRAVGANGSVADEQVLYNDSLMQSVYRSLQSIVGTGATGTDTGMLKSLRDIGIDLDQYGRLVTSDADKFEDALLGKLDQVMALFGFSSNASNGLEVVDRKDAIPAALIGKSITVRVTATDAEGLPTAAEFELDGVVTTATIANGFIRGPAGTAYEGLVVGYTGGVISGTPYEGTLKLSQGIADQIAAVLEPTLNSSTGTLKAARDSLTSLNTRLESQIADFQTQLDLYRDRLLLTFQAAQQAIQALESQKSSIMSYIDSLNAGS